MIHRVNYKPLIILLVILGTSAGIHGQYSRTYDLYGFSGEGGRDVTQIDDKLYVTSSSVCEFPVRFCTDLVCFKENGDIDWIKKLDWMSPAVEGIAYANDDIFLAGIGNSQPLELIVYHTNTNNDSLGVLRIDMDGTFDLVDVLSLKDSGSALIMNGSCRRLSDDSQNAFMAWINYDLTLDTLIINDGLGLSTYLESQFDENGNIYALLIGSQDNPNNNGSLYFRGIIKYDEFKKDSLLFKTDLEPQYNPGGLGLDIFLNGNFVFVNQNGQNFNAPKIQCFDPLGTLLWEYIYEFEQNQHVLIDLKILEDETILICGSYTSLGEDIFGIGCTMKLNSTGEPLWSRYYSVGKYADDVHESLAGKERFSSLYGFIVEEDSIFLTGSASNVEFDEEWHNHSDIWLLKVGEDGCFIPDCTNWQNVSSTADYNLENKNISLYPVPTSDILNIEYMGDGSYETIIIYDLQGQPIYTIIGSTDQIEVSILPSGVYVARFYDRDNQTIAVKKFSKI
jgi:hypothetical protein